MHSIKFLLFIVYFCGGGIVSLDILSKLCLWSVVRLLLVILARLQRLNNFSVDVKMVSIGKL